LRRTPRNYLEGFFLFAADQFADSSQSFFYQQRFAVRELSRTAFTASPVS
jgi:hypothetical protein